MAGRDRWMLTEHNLDAIVLRSGRSKFYWKRRLRQDRRRDIVTYLDFAPESSAGWGKF